MPTPHWQPFLIAAPLIAFTPGANQLLSLRNAVQQGAVDALVAVSGRLSASCCWCSRQRWGWVNCW